MLIQKVRMPLIAAIAALAVLTAAGCVTKKAFRKNTEETSTRVSGVESAVEANERRIAELSDDTDAKIATVRGTAEKAVELGGRAMDQAQVAQQKAEQAARGRLLWTVTLSDDSVRFSFDQASIPPEAAKKLDDLVAQAKTMDRALYFEIAGYTDNIGSEEYNLQLGEKRADAVRNYLNQKGIPLHALNVISYGEADPVADNSTPEGRAHNRRVVIRVLE